MQHHPRQAILDSLDELDEASKMQVLTGLLEQLNSSPERNQYLAELRSFVNEHSKKHVLVDLTDIGDGGCAYVNSSVNCYISVDYPHPKPVLVISTPFAFRCNFETNFFDGAQHC
jgi:hypothetical protein